MKKSLAAETHQRFVERMRLFCLLVILLCSSTAARAQFGFGNENAGGPRPVRVALVSETHGIMPGEPFYVALKMTHDPKWHSYWTNPGIGMPTEISLDLPEGFEMGPKISPIPKVKEDIIGNLHYFEDTIYHVYQVTPPASLEAETVTLEGTATWLQCIEDRCDPPQKAPLTLTLAVGEPEINEEVKTAIDAVLAQQPVSLDAWTIEIAQTAENFTFTLTPGEDANPEPGAVYVFEEEQLLEAQTPEISKEGAILIVSLPKADEEKITELKGYLYAPNGWLKDGEVKAMSLPTTVSAEVPAAPEPSTDAAGKQSPKYVTLSGEEEIPLSIWKALLFGLLGGIILNLMPCVFPVISIKILSFVDQAGDNPAKVKQHGLVFGAGVLLSVWILAAFLLGLRGITGEQTGWGAQLGNPIVTGVIVLLLFALALNLMGVFEFGTSLMGVGGDLMQKKGFSGSFFTGVLTTIVATPCSGPFLGAVMGFTFSQPAVIAFLLFTVFGFGVALPYMVLSFFPRLVDKLPPPGSWMETFKHLMAFPMLLAMLFFLSAFGGVTGVSGIIWMLVGLIVIGAGLWVYGTWCRPSRSTATRGRGFAAAAALTFLGLYVSYGATQNRATTASGSTAGGLAWVEWSPERVRDLREEGRMIFVDFTAEW